MIMEKKKSWEDKERIFTEIHWVFFLSLKMTEKKENNLKNSSKKSLSSFKCSCIPSRSLTVFSHDIIYQFFFSLSHILKVIRLNVFVTDTTAPVLQQGKGLLIITIIDVNEHPPVSTILLYPEIESLSNFSVTFSQIKMSRNRKSF